MEWEEQRGGRAERWKSREVKEGVVEDGWNGDRGWKGGTVVHSGD